MICRFGRDLYRCYYNCMIPKVIHYIWVGNNPLGALQKECIDSWRRYLPEYQLKLWNESNLPESVLNHPYVKEMYGKKRWAFVSDYIRFWILNKEGGIYLDTDTEILRSLNPLLDHEVFLGRTKDGFVAAGVIGAVAGHRFIGDCLKVYDDDKEFDPKRTSPQTVTAVLDRDSYPDVVVYDYQYFNPCDDGERCTAEKLSLAYARNHWAESWVPLAWLRKLLRRSGLMPIIKYFYVAKVQ